MLPTSISVSVIYTSTVAPDANKDQMINWLKNVLDPMNEQSSAEEVYLHIKPVR